MRTLVRVLIGFGLAAAAASAWAASGTWTGNSSADALWSTTTNWSVSPVPGTGDTATFNGAGNSRRKIDLGSGVTIATLLFDTANAAAYTIGSGGAGAQTLTLNDSGAVTMNATVVNDQRIDANVLLGTATAGTYTLTNNSTTNTLTFGGMILGGTGGTGAAKTLNVNGAGNTTISGVIGNGGSSALALTINGAATLTGSNLYTGAVTVSSGGILNIRNGLALGTTAGGTTVNAGGELQLQGGIVTAAEALTLNGSGTATTGSLRNISTFNAYLGAITLGSAVRINADAGRLHIGSTITNAANLLTFGGSGDVVAVGVIGSGAGGLTKDGTGTLALYGANTYTGTTTLGGGTLLLMSAETVGTSGPMGKQVAAAAGTIVFGGGTLQYSQANNTDYSGRFSTAANQAIKIDTNGRDVTFATALTSSGGTLTKYGSGTLTLSGSNTYSGGTTISGGTLLVTNVLPDGTTAVTSGGSLSMVNGSTGTLSPNGATLSLVGGANMAFDWSASAADQLALFNPVVASGVIGITLSPIGTPAGSPTLISSFAGGLTSGGASYYLANATNFRASLTATDGSLSVGSYASATALTSAYWIGNTLAGNQTSGVDNAMALSNGSTSNWSSASSYTATPLVPGSGTNVFFAAVAGATPSQQSNIVLGSSMAVNSLTFSDAAGVTIANDGGSLTLKSTATGTSSAISTNQNATINNDVLLGANQTWTTAAGRTLTMGGRIGEANATYTLTLAGAAGSTVNLSGVSSYSGLTTVSGGTVNYTSTASKQYVNNTSTNSDLTVSGGVVNVNGIVDVDNLALSSSLNVNSGGTLVLRGNPTLSNYLNVTTGGTVVALGTMPVNGASAVLRVAGGTLTMGNTVLGVNGGSGGELTITGGAINHGVGTSAFNIGNGSGVGGTGVVNVVGGLLDNTGAGIYAAEGNGGNPGVVAILNLNGGLLISNDILRSTQGNQRPGYGAVNFGGGTVKASAASTTYFSADGLGSGAQPNNTGTEVRKVYVNAGGGTFDTNGFNVTIPAALQAPAGNGVSPTITVGSAGSGYIGAPLVTINDTGVSVTGSTAYTSYQITGLSSTAGIVVGQEVTGPSFGGGSGSRAYVTAINGNTVTLSNWMSTTGSVTATFKGTGATAYATIGGGGLTGITLTNPGVGYATPSISLSGGLDSGGAAASGFGLTTAANSSGGFTKSGPGTLVFSNYNSYGSSAAGTTVNGGTLQMSINGSRLAVEVAPLSVNNSGVFDLNGTNQTVGNFGGTSGTVLNSAVGTPAVLTVGNGNGTGGTFAGVITDNTTGVSTGGGTVAFVKTGSGTIGLSGLNTFTGGTTVSGGTLLVDFATNATNILPLAGRVTLGGGTLGLRGAAGATNGQTIASLALARGASAIAPDLNGANSLTLNLSSITRGVGSTLDVSNVALFGGASVTTTSGTPGEIFLSNGVAYATVGGADWAAKDNIITTTSLVGLADVNGYTASTPTDLSGNADVSSNVDTTLAANATITSLRFAVAEQRSINLGGNTLTTGGVLAAPAIQASQITGGTLRGPAGADLVVVQNGGLPFTIGATIADNASATGLTKSGTGTLVLTGANTFTGVTSVNAGTLSLQSANALSNTAGTVVAAGATLGLGANETVGSLAGAGTVTLGGNVLTAGNDGSSTVFSGTIGGTGGIAKAGLGTFMLSGTNTYTGTTTISGGTLRAGATAALGVNSAVTLANVAGATLDLGGFATAIGSLTGGGASGGTVALGNARLTVGGDGTSPAAFAGTISGPSAGGSLTKVGSGTLILSGTSTYRGDTTVSAGTLQAGSSMALAPYTAVVLANTAGATLDLAGFSNTVGSLTGGGASGGNVALGAGTLTIGTDNQIRPAYAGVISGTGSIRKVGSGNLTLTGANTFSGTTFVNQGTLTLSGASATFGSNAVGVSMGGGTLDLGGQTRTVGTVSIMSPATTGNTIQTGTLVATSYAASNTYGNAPLTATVTAILQGTGATLTKSGGGVLDLNAANTYDGLTTITAGVIKASNAASLGATTAGTQVSSGAALQVGASLNAEPITLSGTGFSGDGALRALGAVNVTGPVTLAASSRINSDAGVLTLNNATAIGGTGDLFVGGANGVTIASAIATGGSAGLTKDGAGTLTLQGANTFGGPTTLVGGTLTLDYGTQNNSKLADAAVLSVGNGTLTLAGATGSHTEVVGSTTFTTGATSVTRSAGTSVLQLNALTRNVGAAVNFGAASIATADTSNDATGILGGWAVVNNTDWAVTATSAADTSITALPSGSYTTQNVAGSWATDQHVTTNAAVSGTTSSGLSIASLRFNAAAVGTVTIGDTLTVSSGGILETGTVVGNLQTITGGTLRGAAGADLVIHQGASTNSLTIASVIANNTSATALTKAGAGTLTLTNSGNSYTGGTILNAGSLTAQAATQSTTQSNNVLGTGPLVLNGGQLNLRDNGDGVASAQTINYGINTTLNGATTVTVDRVATSTTKTIRLGTLTINNNPTLTVTNTNSYGLRFGATTLAGNATFAPSAAAGLLLDTVDFGNAPRALTMSGAGELQVGYTGGATNVAPNTNWTVSAGTLTAVAAGALGGSNDTVTLSGGVLQLLSDGTGTGLGNGAVQTIVHGDNVILTASRTITAGKLGASGNAANKRFQLGSLVIPNNSTLTYNANNGSAIEFTGTVTLGSAGGAASNKVTFLGGTAGSTAPINQGLILSGVVQGGGFWMGTGFVQLTNPNNTFSSAEWIINGMGNGSPNPGILSFTNSGAMGAASNVYAIGQVSQGSPTLQFDGTFSVVHQIYFGSTNNNNGILDVTQGNVATMAMPFNGGAFNAQGFTKTGNGVLAIAVDNNNNGAGNWWNGPATVSAGAIRVQHEGALGSTALVASTQTIGNTVVNQAVGAAVQFDTSLVSGSMTVAEPFSITGTGLNNAGALQAMNGTTTLTGAIAMTGASTIGADSGATLVVSSQVSGAQALTVAGAGNTVLADGFAANVTGLTKIGSGTLTVAVDNSGNTGGITVNLGTLRVGDAATGLGRTAGNLTLTPGATLVIDNTAAGVANRLGGNAKTVSLSGATLSFIGNNVTEALGALTPAAGASTVSVSGTGGAINFASLGTRAAGGTLNFTGSGPAIQLAAATTVTDGLLMGGSTSAAYFAGTDFATSTGAANANVTAYAGYATGNLGTASTGATVNFKLSGAQSAFNSKTVKTLSMADGRDVTISAGQTLTLDAAAVINNGGGSISGGTLTTTSNRELILNYVTSGTIGSVIGGSTGGLTKVGLGTLTLTGQNTYTGQTTVNQGTLALAGGNNTLAGNQALVVNQGATLNLGANNQYVGALSSTGTIEGAGGTISGSGTLTANFGAAAGTFAGNIGGAVNFVRVGATNALTLTSVNSTTGTVTVNGGAASNVGVVLKDGGALLGTSGITLNGASLTIDNTGTKYLNDRVNDNAAITLNSGAIVFNGRAQSNSAETLGAVTAARGVSAISAVVGGTNVNSAQLTLTSLTRTAGASILVPAGQTNLGLIGNNSRIVVAGGLSGNLAPVNGVVPGVFYMVNTDNYYFTGYSPGLGFGQLGTVGFPSTVATFTSATGSTDNVSGASGTIAANQTINSFKEGNLTFTNGTATGGTDLLTIASGMTILNNITWGTTTQRGRITSGTQELFLFKRDANVTPDPVVNTVIADNGNPVSLVVHSQHQDRGPYVVLTAPNTYSGGTFVNGGYWPSGAAGSNQSGIELNATTAGTVVIPAGGLTINNLAVVDMVSFAGQIDPSNVVTINGGGMLRLMGTNTLAGIVFNSNGGTVVPTVIPYSSNTVGGSNSFATFGAKTGTLVVTGNITSNPSNVAVTPLLDSGTLDLNNSTAHDITVAALAESNYVNGVGALNGLTISSVIQNGGFTKKGAGVLNVTGTNTFAGQLTVEEGVLNVATVNAASANGPLGNSASPAILGGSGGKTGIIEYTGATASSTKTFTMATGGAGGFQVDAAATTLTLSAAIAGAGNLVKGGAGTLSLTSGAHTLSGRTIVSAGTLTLSNSGTSNPLVNNADINVPYMSPYIDVQRGATLNVNGLLNGTLVLGTIFDPGSWSTVGQAIGGNGTVVGNLTIASGTTLSPGASPGILTVTSNATWASGGNYNWQVYDAAGTAGTGFDQMSIGGTLTIGSGFNLNLWSLAGIGPDVSGDAINFNAGQNAYWVIATATGGLINAANLASANIFWTANNGTNGFTNSLNGGTFALVQGGQNGGPGTLNDVVLTYSSMIIPEPDTLALAGVGAVLAAWAARRARRRA